MFMSLREMAREPESRVLLLGAATAIGVGMVVYHVLEGWSWVNCLYFTVVTLATVGYGDLHPTTEPAKLFTVLYVLVGIGILAGFVSELTKHRQAARIERAIHRQVGTCPTCGHVTEPSGHAVSIPEENR